jgi:hypothetical protein
MKISRHSLSFPVVNGQMIFGTPFCPGIYYPNAYFRFLSVIDCKVYIDCKIVLNSEVISMYWEKNPSNTAGNCSIACWSTSNKADDCSIACWSTSVSLGNLGRVSAQ